MPRCSLQAEAKRYAEIIAYIKQSYIIVPLKLMQFSSDSMIFSAINENLPCTQGNREDDNKKLKLVLILTDDSPGRTYSGNMLTSLKGGDSTRAKLLLSVRIADTLTRGHGSLTK